MKSGSLKYSGGDVQCGVRRDLLVPQGLERIHASGPEGGHEGADQADGDQDGDRAG
jgi:hypothetical protein